MDEKEHVEVGAAERAIERLREGGLVVIANSRGARNQGTLTVAAEFATEAAVNRLTRHSVGAIYLCLSDERYRELGLAVGHDGTGHEPGQTISVADDAEPRASAAARARTIRIAAAPAASPADLAQPGYVTPLRARSGGVLRLATAIEAAVDLAALAGTWPAAATSPLLAEDGSVPTGEELEQWCRESDTPLVTVADVIAYRRRTERNLVERMTSVNLPTAHGGFTSIAFREPGSDRVHLALVMGDVTDGGDTLVRVQRACLAGDVFAATTCDCSETLRRSLDRIAAEGRGVIAYLNTSDAGSRLGRHDEVQRDRHPYDYVDEYGIGAQILADIGVSRIRVLGRREPNVPGIEGFGLEVVGYEALTPSS